MQKAGFLTKRLIWLKCGKQGHTLFSFFGLKTLIVGTPVEAVLMRTHNLNFQEKLEKSYNISSEELSIFKIQP